MRKTAVFAAASFFVVALAVTAMASAGSGPVLLNTIWFPPGQPNMAPYEIWWDGSQSQLIAQPPANVGAPQFFQLGSDMEGSTLVNGVTLIPTRFEPANGMHGDMATFYQYLPTTYGPVQGQWMGASQNCGASIHGITVHAHINPTNITLIFPGTGVSQWTENIDESGMAVFGEGNPYAYAVTPACVFWEEQLATSDTFPTPNNAPYMGIYVAEALPSLLS